MCLVVLPAMISTHELIIGWIESVTKEELSNALLASRYLLFDGESNLDWNILVKTSYLFCCKVI